MSPVRLLSAMVVVALVLSASCASDTGGDPGDDTEAITSVAPVDTEIRELLALVPSAPVRATLSEAVGRATDAAQCTQPSQWVTSAADVAEHLVDAAAMANDDPEALDGWLFTDASREFADRLQQLVADAPTCPGEDDAVLATTGRVSSAIDTYRTATTSGLLGLASGFWLNFDYLGHGLEAARLQSTGDGTEVLVVGDSAVKRGIDPARMTEALDRSALNAATDGLLPSMAGPWIGELRRIGARPDTVVIGVTSWGAVVPCSDARPVLLAAFERARARAFAGLITTSPGSDFDRVIGSPADDYQSPLLDRYHQSHPSQGRGRFEDPPASGSDSAVQAQVAYHTQLFADPLLCEEAASSFEAAAADLVEGGASVLVVAMPVSEPMAALHPQGRAGHDALFARYAVAAEVAGATFLDLSTALTEGQFHDPAHPNQRGQQTLTEAVIDALA